MGTQIACHFAFRTNLREDEIEDIGDEFAPLNELDWRDDDALLKDFPESTDARGGPATYIHMVRQVGNIPQASVVVIYW